MASIDKNIEGLIQTTEITSGTYQLKINYNQTKHLNSIACQSIASPSFTVGGHEWNILYYPKSTRYEKFDDMEYISLHLQLKSESQNVPVILDYLLLDRNGRPVRLEWQLNWSKTPHVFPEMGHSWGPLRFVNRVELDNYLKGDHFVVLVNIIVLSASSRPFAVPSSNLHEHIGQLLHNKERADVIFEVEGELFHAHRLLLAARSEVFNAQLFGPLCEDGMETVKIGDMKVVTFKALLHFIYTDSLPDETEAGFMSDERLDNARASILMSQHLLVAADRYGLERLKLICEEKLRKNISVDTVATTLALADQHNCPRLKKTCFKFATILDNYIQMTLTDGYAHLLQSCPSVIKEFRDVLVKPQSSET
ncbi:hypothetical protein LUZ60_002952 [Juncus effusus]|nr:hypothetical protein LUZ60_002952 [Juncus effusus]